MTETLFTFKFRHGPFAINFRVRYLNKQLRNTTMRHLFQYVNYPEFTDAKYITKFYIFHYLRFNNAKNMIAVK